MNATLADLARRYAIATEYHSIDGTANIAPDATLAHLLTAFGIPVTTPEDRSASLAAAPDSPAPRLAAPDGHACFLPPWTEDGRAWGIAIQLYQLRSARNWGIGDFADLADFARVAGAEGADFIGLNPLHALFLADPAHRSPFSPSTRRFLNPLYIAVDAVPGFDPASVPAGAVEAARATELVDYPAVTALKLDALRAIWRSSRGDAANFARFRAAEGPALERHALFEAISAHMTQVGSTPGWRGWPEEWQDPASNTVAAFAADRADDVAFYTWLQFLCDAQLGQARDAARAAGMRIGLYLDLAVGESPGGSGTWSERETTVRGVHVGAPPDYFNAAGQDWGLAPISPVRMAASDAAPFRALMQDATRRAGALRIDHAMALWQLFLIPEDATPAGGTYVRYPIGAMIEALAAASQDNRCLVIGEDLGNVPPGFREVMDAAHILSYRILLFERDATGFIPPERYPRNALVCLSTHDLPTFQGWWRGDDVTLRAQHGLIGPAAAAEQAAARRAERHELLDDLVADGLLDRTAREASTPDAAPPALVTAVHRHLARAPSLLFAVRIEDLVGERQPVNLPSTTDTYPNWCRKLGVPIEDLSGTPLFRSVTAALRDERPRPAP